MQNINQTSGLMPEIKSQLERIVDRVTAVMPISEIILFGSYAKGTHDADSDLDICVLTSIPGTHTISAMQEIQAAIAPIQEMPVDLLVYPKDVFLERSKSKLFEAAIAKEGVRIYVK